MKLIQFRTGLLCGFAVALLVAAPANSQPPWSGQTFLSDYSKPQLILGREGKDYQYISPGAEEKVGKYNKVMLDQPEVFISADSPYV